MNSESLPEKLILASTSKYRKSLLQRLAIPFACRSPEIDESPFQNEAPAELVSRLATEKAQAIGREHPESVVIGSDQMAVFDARVIGKPGHFEAALKQLLSFSGQVVEFMTAVTVLCAESGFMEQHTDHTRVHFRELQAEELRRYLEKERPFDCAGAFKAESLGIVLFERINSEDPTALVGLPLIQTAAMLRRAGIQLP